MTAKYAIEEVVEKITTDINEAHKKIRTLKEFSDALATIDEQLKMLRASLHATGLSLIVYSDFKEGINSDILSGIPKIRIKESDGVPYLNVGEINLTSQQAKTILLTLISAMEEKYKDKLSELNSFTETI